MVDIHTQPTDSLGVPVVYVLHTGIGKLNLGTFIIKAPGSNTYTAYTGAFMSYYEEVTADFLRLTDQDWSQKVNQGDIGERPEWTNLYLADAVGSTKDVAVELPSSYLVGVQKNMLSADYRVYPNPVTQTLRIDQISLAKPYAYTLYNLVGNVLIHETRIQDSSIDFQAYEKGLYLLKIKDKTKECTYKIVKQ